MNFKREAIDKLRCYTARQESLPRLEQEVHRLELEFASLKSASSGCTPVHGGTSRHEDALINNIALRAELEGAMKQTREWLSIVDGGLASLDEMERRILDCFYIHSAKGSVERLCDELYIATATAYRRRDEALRHFTLALYGVAEI